MKHFVPCNEHKFLCFLTCPTKAALKVFLWQVEKLIADTLNCGKDKRSK